MKQVKRFPLKIEPKQVLKVPYDSRIVDFTEVSGIPTLWVLCDTDNSSIDRVFVTVKEGGEIEKRMNETNFIGAFDGQADIGSVRLFIFEQT